MHVTHLCILFIGTASAAACAEMKWLLCEVFGGEGHLLTRIPLNGFTKLQETSVPPHI